MLNRRALPLCLSLFAVTCTALTAPPQVPGFLIEAEAAAGDEAWTAQDLDGASGGQALYASRRARTSDATPIPVSFPRPGRYTAWVRYFRETPASPAFFVLIRDNHGEELACHFCDWYTVMPSDQPYREKVPWAGTNRTGFVWEPFEVVIERPGDATVGFQPYGTRGPTTDRRIDAVLFTTDPDLDPNVLTTNQLSSLPSESPPSPGDTQLLPSPGMSAQVDFFAGIDDPAARFRAGLINCGSYFIDAARMVRLGFNHDHNHPTKESVRHGLQTQAHVECYRGNARELASEYHSPTGRFVNAEGNVSRAFSYDFAPIVKSSEDALRQRVRSCLDSEYSDAYCQWRISVEDGGLLDYSEYAMRAFRAWLAAKHGTIDALNARWHTNYESFDDVVPPASFEEDPAAWLEFRDFSGQTYAEAVARQIPIIRKMDPLGRPCMGANSSLDLFAPYFSRLRPIDWDEFVNTALADSGYVAWDTYCADDQLAAEADLVRTFAEDRRIVVQEWSNHVTDPRIAARSYWTFVSKGVSGIMLFMFQEGIFHPTYPKWALLKQDRSPKAKLAAYSDAAQEVHRIEPLLMNGKTSYAVPPVAMYWSRIDLSLAEPYGSLYGCPQNSPIHVYRTLRALGYPVRWITPRQIREGQLNDAAAVVLAGCKYIPGDVASAIEHWVRRGGIVLGDEWPGGWDEYAQPQSTLTPVFGVRKATPKNKGSTLAVQESVQGYGEVTDAAVERKETYTMVDEIAQQPGATHPVARTVGDFMVSGIGPNRVECFDGHVVGMTHRGTAGFVVNDYGKGQAFYSALMLGTVYESGGTPYEWDTAHSGLAYARMLDAFLRYAGLHPAYAVSGLVPRVAAKLRIETPLVTPDGNVFIGMTSINDDRVGPFDVDIALPPDAGRPVRMVLVATGGNRHFERVEHVLNGSRLKFTMPRFDTHAAVLVLTDSDPLVSLDLKDPPRSVAALAEIAPAQEFDVGVTVWNPSGKRIKKGTVDFAVPDGWFQSALSHKVEKIEPGQSATVSFRVRSPDIAGPRRLRPLTARFTAGKQRSTPATEMVWWGKTRENWNR